MTLDPRTPVLVGVGQVGRHDDIELPVTQRPEPVALMADALQAAAADCQGAGAGNRLLQRAQSMRIMVPLSWGYINPGRLVAQRLRIEPDEHVLTVIGGNSPQMVVNRTAAAIATGQLDVALIAGADCIATRVAARRDPEHPTLPWTVQPDDTPEPVRFGEDRRPVDDIERGAGLDRPVRVYPLFENALRAAAGERMDEHQVKVSELWAAFSDVASTNPHAWSRRAYGASDIRTVGPDNRMVAFPYPKLMVANDRVDQGAALIMCSVSAARAAGVAEDRWVFPVSGADATDRWSLSERQNLSSSPALGLAGRRALELARCGIDDVELLDLYSCFPCAVQIAAAELGVRVGDTRPLTVTGGLTFAGGPGNNYVSHSIATMADKLRAGAGAVGLVTGVGWYLTKHSVGLWSSAPPAGGFRHDSPQAQVDALPMRHGAPDYEGDVTVETYTVIYGRGEQPEFAVLAALTGDGRRTWGSTTDADALATLTAEEGCGRAARTLGHGRVELT